MFGEHIDSVKKIPQTNGKIVQMFVSVSKNHNDIENIKNSLVKKNISPIIHISYTINCAQNWDKYSWHIQQFIMELKIASELNALFAVVHIGKQLGISYDTAISNIVSSLLYVSSKVPDMKILLETSSGQGTEMCYELDELAVLYNKLIIDNQNKNNFGICIDTCHIFASGYDISNTKGIYKYFKKFDKLIGVKNIGLIHLNDSKNECGSKIDRHENIGNGFIGKKPLLEIVKFAKKLGINIILETPSQKGSEDMLMVKNIYKE